MSDKPKTKKPEIPKEEMQRFLMARRKMIHDLNEKQNQRKENE